MPAARRRRPHAAPLNNRLYDVGQWLDRNEVVQRDNRVLIGIALLFLGVCLVNVVGLLLAKFLNAAPLTGLRRALGASRRDIVRQHMTEVLLIGLAGGLLGLLLGHRRPRRHPLASTAPTSTAAPTSG